MELSFQKRWGIVGAGIAGLTFARSLVGRGICPAGEIVVFDKSRGVGGRTATRRSPAGSFDHGAQYTTAKTPAFAGFLERCAAEGFAAPWEARFGRVSADGEARLVEPPATRWVGLPGMNGLAKFAAQGLEVAAGCRIADVTRTDDGWLLVDDEGGRHRFDRIVLSAPPEQTAALLAQAAPETVSRIGEAEQSPCWAAMIRFEAAVDVPYDAAEIESDALVWAARNASKPGREKDGETWVLHASEAWTRERLETPRDDVARAMLDAFAAITGGPLPAVDHLQAHRWLLGFSTRRIPGGYVWDEARGLGICGDWLDEPRVEGAFASGLALAAAVSESVS